MSKVKPLLDILSLEKLERNLFRGDSRDIGSNNVFGGQVVAQALNAAIQTVEEARFLHSMHGYFILPGDMDHPIIYEVDRIRNGRSFTTRRVVAIQHGEAIFNLSASFQIDEDGLNHQTEMPDVPGPEGLVSMADLRKKFSEIAPPRIKRFFQPEWPIDFRLVEVPNPFSSKAQKPIRHAWLRAPDPLPEDVDMHKCVLAYASDFNLLLTALLPHGITFGTTKIKLASLDHAMWFHRPFRADEWLLYVMESPSTSGSRGMCFGHFYKQDGTLVATVAQEGLVRLREK